MGEVDLVAALALADWATARARAAQHARRPCLMAKRNAIAAARWLLERRADPNGRWRHAGPEVTPLHLAVAHGRAAMIAGSLVDASAPGAVRAASVFGPQSTSRDPGSV